MSGQRLNLCATQRAYTREGHTGPNAHMLLPFLSDSQGIWFADGRQLTVNNATVAQFKGTTLGAQTKPNTYKKDCCHCS